MVTNENGEVKLKIEIDGEDVKYDMYGRQIDIVGTIAAALSGIIKDITKPDKVYENFLVDYAIQTLDELRSAVGDEDGKYSKIGEWKPNDIATEENSNNE